MNLPFGFLNFLVQITPSIAKAMLGLVATSNNFFDLLALRDARCFSMINGHGD